MGRYLTKSKSNKWTRVIFAYILDTIRVNVQTIWSLATNQEPRYTNSFVFGIQLALALLLPLIENRPLVGLQGPIQCKMSFMLKRPVGRFGYDPGQPAIAAAGAAAAAGTAAVQGAAAATRRSLTRFRQQLEKDERPKRCTLCYNAIPSVGHKEEKEKVGKVKTLFGSCGNPCCQRHHNILCTDCSAFFVAQQ